MDSMGEGNDVEVKDFAGKQIVDNFLSVEEVSLTRTKQSLSASNTGPEGFGASVTASHFLISSDYRKGL